MITEELLIEFMNYHKLSREISLKLLNSKTSPYCKCGNFKKLKKYKNSKIGIGYDQYCTNKKCSPNYGQKRPEQSRKMKENVINGSDAYKATLIKKGEIFNKDVNTIKFKKIILNKAGIICDNLQDNEIELIFSMKQSNYNKSILKRKQEILQRYNNWESEYKKLILIVTDNIEPTFEWLNTLDDINIQNIWKRIHGINTIRNNSKIKENRNGFYKRIFKDNFKYNFKNQKSITTKSGLESTYIDFFESNGIYWSYETIVVENINKDGFHTPDFVIKLNNEEILLEVKGNFYRQEIKEYLSNKVTAAINYAHANNMYYVLTADKKPNKNFNFITNAIINTKIK